MSSHRLHRPRAAIPTSGGNVQTSHNVSLQWAVVGLFEGAPPQYTCFFGSYAGGVLSETSAMVGTEFSGSDLVHFYVVCCQRVCLR